MNYLPLFICILFQAPLVYGSSYEKLLEKHEKASTLCRKTTCPFMLTYSKQEVAGVYTVATLETDQETGAPTYYAYLITQHEGIVIEEKSLNSAAVYFNKLSAEFEQQNKTCTKTFSADDLQCIESYKQKKDGWIFYAQKCRMYDGFEYLYAYGKPEKGKKTFPEDKEYFFNMLREVYKEENPQEKRD